MPRRKYFVYRIDFGVMVQVTDRVRTMRKIEIALKINGKRGWYRECIRMLPLFDDNFVFYILSRLLDGCGSLIRIP